MSTANLTNSSTASLVEVWKPIRGFTGLYEVSDHGRIKALARTVIYFREGRKVIRYKKETIIKPGVKPKTGYLRVSLYKRKLPKPYYLQVHRIVASAFIRQVSKREHVNHVDFNVKNNRLDNLEITTPKQNVAHSRKHKRWPSISGENNPMAVLTNSKVIKIKKLLRANKLSVKEIAKITGASRGQVSSINTGNSWRHIKV